MKRLLLVLSILAATNADAANGGEGNNTGCNGVGNVNSPCTGSASVPDPTTTVVSPTISVGPTTVTTSGGTSTANGGSATSNAQGGSGIGGNSNSSSRQDQTQSQSSDRHDVTTNNTTSKVNNAGNNTGTSASTAANSVMVEGDQAQARNPVATAVGPTIITGSDQCLVAISAGVQVIGFGFAIGSAVEDQNCQALKLARQLDSMGYRTQALKLLMLDPRVKAAFE